MAQDIYSQEAQNYSQRLIEKIKNGTIKKRTLPNNFIDYPNTIARKSFQELSKSDYIDKLINEAYND